MLLKVGELARRSGLTVRTLHHFDQIGLLQPSARSEAGYRLYSGDDVARLHGIQALRHLGLPLKQIGLMLTGQGEAMPQIVAHQIRALDQEITRATALRGHLALLMDKWSTGDPPATDEWLDALALMAACASHFDAAELRTIVANWRAMRTEWAPLAARVRALMDRGVPAADVQVQPLAQQWMGLVHHWLGGDFDLIERWGRVLAQAPQLRRAGGPDPAMLGYLAQAIDLRMAAWRRHFSLAEMARFERVDPADWTTLAADGEALLAAAVPPHAPAAQALAGRLAALIRHTVGHDAELVPKMVAALAAEPLLQAGALLPAAVRAFIQAAAAQARPAAHALPAGR